MKRKKKILNQAGVALMALSMVTVAMPLQTITSLAQTTESNVAATLTENNGDQEAENPDELKETSSEKDSETEEYSSETEEQDVTGDYSQEAAEEQNSKEDEAVESTEKLIEKEPTEEVDTGKIEDSAKTDGEVEGKVTEDTEESESEQTEEELAETTKEQTETPVTATEETKAETLVTATEETKAETKVQATEDLDTLEVQEFPSELQTIDPENWYKSPLLGLYRINIKVSESVIRPVYLYVPEKNEPNQSVIHIAIDSSEKPEEFIEKSGWRQLADENGFLLYIYTADGDWENYTDEKDYLSTSYTFLTKRPYVDVRKHNMYMAAYGDAADVGMQFALNEPRYFAGILADGTTGMSEKLENQLKKTKTNFYNDKGEQLLCSEVVHPIWIVTKNKDENTDRLVDFLKKSNRTVASTEEKYDAEYYAPDEAQFTGNEEEAIGGIYLENADIDDTVNYEFSEKIWENLFKGVRRYPDFGEVRSYVPSDEDHNMERHEDVVDGYQRVWYTYVPDSVKDENNVPAVFVFHGNGGGPTEIADQMGWKKLADQLGVMLVIPQGSASWATKMSNNAGVDYQQYTTTWTTKESETLPNDMEFMDYLYQWLTEDSDFADKVDASRIFASGQSMGGFNSYNMIYYRPQYFAAVMPNSFIKAADDETVTKYDVPVMNTMGQQDTTIPGAFKTALNGAGKKVFDYFLDRYDLTEQGDQDRTYDDFTFMEKDAKCTEKNGPLNTYIFDTKEGYPMFTAAECVGCGHATTVTEVKYFYDHYIENYTRDPETKVLYYDGKVVDTPANLALYNGTENPGEILVAKELPKAEDIHIDYDDYNGQKIQGYYNFNCVVSKDAEGNKKIRTAKFYIPEGTVFNQPTVFVGVPNGVDTGEFLVKSGWKDLADKKKLHIVMMEPENGQWDQGEDDIKYIKELNTDVSYRPFFCAFSSNFYGIGYGESADVLRKNSQENPKSWAGIALLGDTDMTEAELKHLETTDSKVKGVPVADVMTPAWIVASEKDEGTKVLLDFYKHANHAQEVKSDEDFASEVYLPQDGGSVDDEWCAATIYDEADWKDCVNEEYSEKVYDKLFDGVYRYPGNANGALRRPGDIYERGFKYFQAKVPGGYKDENGEERTYNREWYVYVPDSVDTSSPAPLVFVFHGAGGSGNEIADRSGWAKVAKDNGIIIVMPTGSHFEKVRDVSDMQTNEYFRAMWNTGDATATRPSDLKFVEYLYDWMKEHYKIDATRVYASGQSSGGMMTWACAAKLPNIFAAAAPVSAYNAPDPVGTSVVPVDCYIGEQDTTFPGGFSGMSAEETVEKFTKLYNTKENYEDYKYLGQGQTGEKTDLASSGDKLLTRYLFEAQDGTPLIRADEVATKTHAIWPSECYMTWETWLSHFTKDADGKLYYDGKLVNESTAKPEEDEHKPEADNSDTNKNSITRGHIGSSGGHSGKGTVVSDSSKIVNSDGKSGEWKQNLKGWWFKFDDGSFPTDKWEKLLWNGTYNWYHFDKEGYLQGGWFTDGDGNTYYLHEAHDGNFGYMHTGWSNIGDKSYFFEPVAGKLQGHLYRSGMTPDGYQVDENGVWNK